MIVFIDYVLFYEFCPPCPTMSHNESLFYNFLSWSQLILAAKRSVVADEAPWGERQKAVNTKSTQYFCQNFLSFMKIFCMNENLNKYIALKLQR